MDIKLETKKQSVFIYFFKMILALLCLCLFLIAIFSFTILKKILNDNTNMIFENIYTEIKQIDDFNLNSKEFKSIIDLTRMNNCIIEVYDSSNNTRIYSPYIYENNIFSHNDSKKIFDEIIGENQDVCIFDGNSIYQYAIDNLNGQKNQYSMLIRKSDNIYILIQTSMDSYSIYKNTFTKIIIYCFCIAAFFGCVPAYFISRNIIGNINSIRKIAKKISENDFSEQCANSKISELDDLSESINIMSHSLKNQLNEIKEKNELLNSDIENRKIMEQTQKDFVSNVSHELKTPISIVSGYTEGIKYDLVTTKEEQIEYCDTILKECNRMTNIVKQLLDLSAIENNKVKLNIEKNNISDMLNIIIEKFLNKYNDRNFINNVNSNLFGFCDYDEIEKVIINYIDNAIKYSQKDIDIRSFYDSEYVYIGVHSYSYINDDDINKIWDRFYRADKSHTRNENSTGLGLSIVKATMINHNMPYGVNKINNGIEFFIKIKKNI